jgi:hypothetical protein
MLKEAFVDADSTVSDLPYKRNGDFIFFNLIFLSGLQPRP